MRTECPRAAAGSPQDPESTQMSNEVIGTMVTTAMRTDLPSIRAYLSTARRIHFASGRLNSIVRSYVGKLTKLAALAPPNLCGDVRAWAASGYRALPASTVAFDKRFVPSWVALGEVPASISRFDRGLAARSASAESRLGDFEASEVETWGHIMNALELWP